MFEKLHPVLDLESPDHDPAPYGSTYLVEVFLEEQAPGNCPFLGGRSRWVIFFVSYSWDTEYYTFPIVESNLKLTFFCSIFWIYYILQGTIMDLVKQKGRLQESVVKNFTWQLLSAVDYLHTNETKKVIHKDIKG